MSDVDPRSFRSRPVLWRRRANRVGMLALGLGLGCALATDLRAQSTPTAPEATAEATSVIRPIPISRITPEAERTRRHLREVESLGRTDPTIEADRAAVTAFYEWQESLRQETVSRLAEPLALRQIQNFGHRWQRADAQMASLREEIDRHASRLEVALESLSVVRQRWQATGEATEPQTPPSAIEEVTARLLAEIREIETAIGSQRASLLDAQELLYECDRVSDDVRRRIDAALIARQTAVLDLDHAPLWETFPSQLRLRHNATHGLDNLGRVAHEFGELASAERRAMVLLGFFLIVAATSLYAMRRHAAAPDTPTDLAQRLVRVARTPLATAAAVTLSLFLLASPHAPPSVLDTVAIALFLPFLVMIAPEVPHSLRRRFTVIWGLFVIDRITMIFDPMTSLPRVLLLIEGGAALALFVIMGRRGIEVLRGRSSLQQSIGRVVLVAFGAQAVAAIGAVVLGYVGLAQLLTSAVVISLYVAVLLRGLFPVLQGFLHLGPDMPGLRNLRVVQRHRELILRRTLLGLQAISVLAWAYGYLTLLGVLPAIRRLSSTVLDGGLRFGDIHVTLGAVAAFAFTLWITTLVSRFVRFVLEEDIFDRVSLPRGVAHAVSTSVHYLVLFTGFVLAVAATGVDLSRITLLIGAFGVGIGFGLQNIVNNFVSGIILIAERPIMPGDVIELDNGLSGEVRRLGIRSSVVRTFQGAEVIVPNGELISRHLTNWTLSDRTRRVEIDVDVAYGSDAARVLELLLDVVQKHHGTLDQPPPSVLCLGFGDSAIHFSARAWSRFDEWTRVRSELTIEIERALREAGIEIPFPQRVVHLVEDDVRAVSRREIGPAPEPGA